MSDPLFAGLTRQTIIWGVPADALKVLVVVSSIIFIGWKSLWSILAFPVLYVPVYLLCYKDPNIFYLGWLSLKTRWRSNFRSKYSSSSASVFKPTRPRGML